MSFNEHDSPLPTRESIQPPTGSPSDLWNTFRLQFPVTQKWVYMNHAAVSPLPLRCKDRMEQYLEELTHNGAAHYPGRIFQNLKWTRALGALLLGGKPEHTFIVRSTTQGLGIAATGIPFQPGDNVVLVHQEFPANIRPWLPLQRRDVQVRFVKQKNGRVELDDLAAAMDAHTRALSISFVQFLNGFKINLGSVAELCRKHDALFVVDAIQGLGAMQLDVEADGIDFLSADAHKWMLGPEGVGLGYASSRALNRIQPALEGWLSMESPFNFFDVDQPLKSTAARYEEGAYNVAGFHGFAGTLELLLSVGVVNLQKRILELTDVLAEGLTARGWTLRSPRDRESEKSGIVTVTRDDVDVSAVNTKLKERGFVVSARQGHIRISPHGYNTLSDIEHFLETLGRLT